MFLKSAACHLQSKIPKEGLLAKSGKVIFQGRAFLEGKIQKNGKKFLNSFIVPKRLLGHTDHLYTYKGHVEHVGFTEKRQKLSKLTIWALFWLKVAIFVAFGVFM